MINLTYIFECAPVSLGCNHIDPLIRRRRRHHPLRVLLFSYCYQISLNSLSASAFKYCNILMVNDTNIFMQWKEIDTNSYLLRGIPCVTCDFERKFTFGVLYFD